MNNQHGFTLLEILVVVVLIAISVTFVGFSINQDVDEIAKLESRRFISLVEQLREEAVLSGKNYAVEVDTADRSYQFHEYTDKLNAMDEGDVFRKRSFPENIDVLYQLPVKPKAGQKPLVVVDAFGQISLFTLTLSGENRKFRIEVDPDQNLVMNELGLDDD